MSARIASAAELQEISDRGIVPRLTAVTIASVAGEPAPERKWIVPGLIPDRNVTDMAGDGGTGKSLITLQLEVAMTTGTDWLGHMPIPGRCLYISCEDDLDEIRRRIEAIAKASGGRFTTADLDGLHVADLTSGDTELAVLDKGQFRLTPLFDAVSNFAHDFRPKLIAIDTRADVFGGSEIDRGQVRYFVRALRRLCFEHDMAILLLSHPSLTGMSSGTGQSGSTGWGNGVRSRLYLERPKAEDGSEPDPNLRVLSMRKNNFGPTDVSISLRWSDGVFRPDNSSLCGLDRLSQEKAAEERFLTLLKEFEMQGRTVNNAGGPHYAPKAFAAADSMVGRNQFRTAMERLFAAGTIRMEAFGPPSRGTKRIVIAS